MTETIICQRCGSIDDYYTVHSGPHLKAICNGCDRYIKFISKREMTPELIEFTLVPSPSNLKPQVAETIPPSNIMANGLYGSICLEDVFSGQVMKGQDGRSYICLEALQGAAHQVGKNGKHYVNIGVWINDEADQYGNNAGITLSQSKEDREAKVKRTYIGNLRYNSAPQQQQAPVGGYPPQQGFTQNPAAYQQQPAQPWQPGGAPAPQPWQQPAPAYQPGGYPGAAPAQQTGYPPQANGGGNYPPAQGPMMGQMPGVPGDGKLPF